MRSPQEDCLLRSKQATPYAPPLGLEMGANSQWYRRAGVCQTGGGDLRAEPRSGGQRARRRRAG
jgi:hypothetical protein